MPDVHESWPFINITNKICSGTESLPQAAFGQLLETQLNADYSSILFYSILESCGQPGPSASLVMLSTWIHFCIIQFLDSLIFCFPSSQNNTKQMKVAVGRVDGCLVQEHPDEFQDEVILL